MCVQKLKNHLISCVHETDTATVDADHFVGYTEDKARALHCDDPHCETVRKEQDGMHCKLHGLTVVFGRNFHDSWLALCATEIT